jgi:type IV pilus assembly protein PilE
MSNRNYIGKIRAGGFTLIELMVTVAIVAIIAAIAYPSYTQHIIRGKRTAAKAAMMDIANREQQFLLANRSYADKASLVSNGYTLESAVSQNYSWDATANNGASPPTFLITFTPTGTQASDGALTLDSVGTKNPAEKWVR